MAYPISDVTRRVVYSGSAGVGPYNFTFEILTQTDIAVYKNSSLLTLTTDYTVTINSNGTGSITLVSAATGSDNITIVGDRGIQRTTDFVTGGDLFANTLNQELDALTIYSQQVDEKAERGLKAPVTDPTDIAMTLPSKTARANKTLAFDNNGNPVTGEVIGDNRGNWAAGTSYNKRDIVKDTTNGNIYYANTSHVSTGSLPISTNTDSAKWDLIVDNASAGAAQLAAEAAQAAAETAEANAETAETNAETAATNAASSASAASTSASNASTSASNAASSASSASTQASNAATSASAAATSATSASNSASAASTSASNAASSASAASTSASNASTSATNAASSASSASSSASTATTQATNAANSASAAATSATNASNSASAASTSATNASNSATAAAASAAAAASSLDSFDDRYLGSKASDPTVDNDGNPLVTGALYYNTTTQTMKVYDGANWIAATAAGTSAMTRYRYVATAGQTTFSGADSNALTMSYISGNIVVSRNGVVLDTSEYTASNGTSVVLSVAAAVGDVLDIVAFKSFTVADTYTKAEVDTSLAGKVGTTGNETVAGVKTFSSQPVFSAGVSLGSNGQIVFPATQNASADANTLDDYEEGTFTPTLQFGGSTTGITYSSTRLGSYTKVGRMVYGAIRFALTSKGSATGLATITGLPFTCINTEGYNGGVWEAYGGNMASWNVPKQFIIDVGSSTIFLRYAAAASGTLFTEANFTNTSDLILNFCYQVQ
jgi:hypothetical protein